jgi:hypothetical protein
MNLTELTSGLNAFTTASRQRNVFIIAARNAILSEIGAPFITFTVSNNNVTTNQHADTTRLITLLGTLSETDIQNAETDLAEIIANRTPATISSEQVQQLTQYGVTTNNTGIRTINASRNQNHTGISLNGRENIRNAITNEANRRRTAIHSVRNTQSTMATGVDSSIQGSIRNLLTRYSNTAFNSNAITAARNGLTQAINTPSQENQKFILPPTSASAPRLNAATLSLTEQKQVALRALSSQQLSIIPIQHAALELNIQQVLSLVWTAIHDRNSIVGPNNQPLTDDDTVFRAASAATATTAATAAITNREAITEAIALRERNLVAALIEFQTEYSTSSAACAHGTYNKIVETLSLAHPSVVVLNQDLSNVVLNQADRYIRFVILPRIFHAQPNQAAISEAYDTQTARTSAQRTALENFQTLLNQALHGQIAGQTSLYEELRTNLCPTIFTAGQYTQDRVLNDLIPRWFADYFPYAGLPDPIATPIPLTSSNVATTTPTTTVATTTAATTTPTTTAATNTAATTTAIVNPTGYNLNNEARLTQFATTPIPQQTSNTGQRNEIRMNNTNTVSPYQAVMALPDMPVCFPYHVTGETDVNVRRLQGVPAINASIRLPAGTLTNLPTGIRELLVQHNINLNNLQVNFCVQDMPWQNDPILLRPHPFLHPTAPQVGNYNNSSAVLVGITDVNSPFGTLANATLVTHGDSAASSVVFSTREFPIQSVTPASGATAEIAAPIQTNTTHAFYSICIDPATSRAALTLHWLLNDTDHQEFIQNILPVSTNIEEIVNWTAGSEQLANSSLRQETNGISAISALYYLINGGQPTLAQRSSLYRVAEQAIATPTPASSSASVTVSTSTPAAVPVPATTAALLTSGSLPAPTSAAIPAPTSTIISTPTSIVTLAPNATVPSVSTSTPVPIPTSTSSSTTNSTPIASVSRTSTSTTGTGSTPITNSTVNTALLLEQNTQLATQLATLQATITQQAQQIQALQSQVNEYQISFVSLTNTYNTAQARAEAASAQSAQDRAANIQLQNAISSMTAAYNQAQNAANAANSALASRKK